MRTNKVFFSKPKYIFFKRGEPNKCLICFSFNNIQETKTEQNVFFYMIRTHSKVAKNEHKDWKKLCFFFYWIRERKGDCLAHNYIIALTNYPHVTSWSKQTTHFPTKYRLLHKSYFLRAYENLLKIRSQKSFLSGSENKKWKFSLFPYSHLLTIYPSTDTFALEKKIVECFVCASTPKWRVS